MNTVIYQQDGAPAQYSDKPLEFLDISRYSADISVVVESFLDALTSHSQPTPLISTHPTIFFRSVSKKGSMTRIPRPWKL